MHAQKGVFTEGCQWHMLQPWQCHAYYSCVGFMRLSTCWGDSLPAGLSLSISPFFFVFFFHAPSFSFPAFRKKRNTMFTHMCKISVIILCKLSATLTELLLSNVHVAIPHAGVSLCLVTSRCSLNNTQNASKLTVLGMFAILPIKQDSDPNTKTVGEIIWK